MTENTVVLIRHGESEFNKANLFCGWYDCPLSPKGLEDAHKIAVAGLRAHNIKFDIIYCSLLTRAQQTVRILEKELNYRFLPIKFNWRLNERHYGNLTGFNKREMANKYGEETVQMWRRAYEGLPPPITPDNPHYNAIRNNYKFREIPEDQFPYTESLKTVMLRALPFWERKVMPKVLKGYKVLVVAHGTVVRGLMKHIEGISDEDIAKLNVPNSVPCVYTYNLSTGALVGGVKYLADDDFIKAECSKVATLGN